MLEKCELCEKPASAGTEERRRARKSVRLSSIEASPISLGRGTGQRSSTSDSGSSYSLVGIAVDKKSIIRGETGNYPATKGPGIGWAERGGETLQPPRERGSLTDIFAFGRPVASRELGGEDVNSISAGRKRGLANYQNT